MPDIALAVHGGAGPLSSRMKSDEGRAEYQRGLAAAVEAGRAILSAGGSAEDAVVAAVVELEDNPAFNAGRGAVLCADGTVELSASLMRGSDGQVGGVARSCRARNPIRAARAMFDHAHGLLSGGEADEWAEASGLAMVEPSYFVTPHRLSQWQRLRGSDEVVLDHRDENDAEASEPTGTVGAVARDRHGHLAAATSTGGMVNQMPGRVGDTPVVGAGTWADDTTCAVSTTGTGDVFARLAFARRVADLVELGGFSIDQAATKTLADVGHAGGEGGCIMVDGAGNIALPFISSQMLRGWFVGDGPVMVALGADDETPAPQAVSDRGVERPIGR